MVYFMHLESKGGWGYKKDYMNSTSGRLRRQEEGSCGNLCDWIRGKMETFFTLVATG